MKSIFRVSLMASQGEDVAGGLHWGVELGWGIRGGGYVVQAQDGGEDDGDVGDGDGGPLAVLTHARSLFLLLPLQISLRPSPTLALSLARSHPLSLSLCFTHSHTHRRDGDAAAILYTGGCGGRGREHDALAGECRHACFSSCDALKERRARRLRSFKCLLAWADWQMLS